MIINYYVYIGELSSKRANIMEVKTNINHVSIIKTLRECKGFKLLAIKKSNGDIGLAISDDKDMVMRSGGEKFLMVSISKYQLWTVELFRELKSKYETIDLFFDEMVNVMGK